MEDYEDYRKNTTMLEKKAIYIGAICTYNLTDPLAKFRLTIDLLIRVSHLPYVINARFILRLIVVLILYQNCANGFYTSKWSFLSGKLINLPILFSFFLYSNWWFMIGKAMNFTEWATIRMNVYLTLCPRTRSFTYWTKIRATQILPSIKISNPQF